MDIAQVYSNISTDFSNTRFSVWKGVQEFLDLIPEGSCIGDIGCGNGKNMMYRCDKLKYVGVDICPEFVQICKDKHLNVIEGSVLNIPYDDKQFDNVICIAVIHHLQDKTNRIKAIEELLRVTKYDGKILIYVWSFNQYVECKHKFKSTDEMVPFTTKNGDKFYRYYHLYSTDELKNDVESISKYNFIIENTFNDKNNEYIIIQKK